MIAEAYNDLVGGDRQWVYQDGKGEYWIRNDLAKSVIRHFFSQNARVNNLWYMKDGVLPNVDTARIELHDADWRGSIHDDGSQRYHYRIQMYLGVTARSKILKPLPLINKLIQRAVEIDKSLVNSNRLNIDV